MEKEKWKDDIISSLEGIKRAEPSPFLFSRIEARLERTGGFSKLQVRLAGSAMIVWLFLNIWWVASFNKKINVNELSITTSYQY